MHTNKLNNCDRASATTNTPARFNKGQQDKYNNEYAPSVKEYF